MDTAIVMKVIRTDILRRGKGTSESPIRIIIQYWSLKGELLAEVDAWKERKEQENKDKQND